MSVFQTVCARCGSLYSCRPCQRVHSQSSPYQSWSQVTGAVPVVKLPPRNYLGLCHIDHFRNGQVSERLLYIYGQLSMIHPGFLLGSPALMISPGRSVQLFVISFACLAYTCYTTTCICLYIYHYSYFTIINITIIINVS